MVIDYLKNMRKDFLKQKLELESESDGMKIRLQENLRVMQHMKDMAMDQYDAFSPRVQNQDLYDSISYLEQENQNLLGESKKKEHQIQIWNSKLEELDLVLKKARVQEAEFENRNKNLTDLHILEVKENERQKIAKNLYEIYITILTMRNRSEFCTRIIDMDSVRCKMELSLLSDMIRTVEHDTDKLMHELQPMPEDISFEKLIFMQIEKLKEKGICADYKIQGEEYTLEPIYMITFCRIVNHIFSFICLQDISDLVLHISLQYSSDHIIYRLEGNWNKNLSDLSAIEDSIHAISGKTRLENQEDINCILIEIPVSSEEWDDH